MSHINLFQYYTEIIRYAKKISKIIIIITIYWLLYFSKVIKLIFEKKFQKPKFHNFCDLHSGQFLNASTKTDDLTYIL